MLPFIVKAELKKILYRKKYYVFIALELAVCCVWLFAANAIRDTFIVSVDASTFSVSILGALLPLMLPICIFSLATDSFTSELDDMTAKAVMCQPANRFKVYFGKVTALMIYLMINIYTVCVVANILQAVYNGKVSVLAIAESLLAYTVSAPPIAALMLFAAAFAQFFKSGAVTVMLLLLVYAALSVAGFASPLLYNISFTSYLTWYKMFIGNALPFATLVTLTGLLTGYGIVFYAAGCLMYDSRDV